MRYFQWVKVLRHYYATSEGLYHAKRLPSRRRLFAAKRVIDASHALPCPIIMHAIHHY